MGILTLILFTIEISIFISIDKKIYNTYFTPVTVLTVPYLFIVIIAILIGPRIGFLKFYYPSLWIWIFGVLFFWIPSFIGATIFLRKIDTHKYPYSIKDNPKLDAIVIKLSYLLLFIMIIGFLKALHLGPIGSERFKNSLASGIVGHAFLISKFFFIYLIVMYRKEYIVPILLFLLLYISYSSKSWILIPILSAAILKIMIMRKRISSTIILSVISLGIIAFYLSYRIKLGSAVPFSFIWMHFFKYTFAGVLGLSEYIKKSGKVGINHAMLIIPLVNFYNKIIGELIYKTYSNVWTFIGLNTYTNVKTFFGTIYLYAGSYYGLIFSFVIGFYSYSLLILSIKMRNIILSIVYITNLSLLLFGWFDIYSSNLFFYEFPVFCILFLLIYSLFAKYFGLLKDENVYQY